MTRSTSSDHSIIVSAQCIFLIKRAKQISLVLIQPFP